MKSTILGIMGVYNRSASAVLETPRGQTPKSLTSMPPHDSADQCVRVPLNSQKYPNLFALVDAEDADLVRTYRWHPVVCPHTTYAGTGRKSMKMHRLVLSAPEGFDVDHINGNGLDNRRSNLRICSRSEHRRNHRKQPGASRFVGVTRKKKVTVRWEASVWVDRKRVHLGYYDTEDDAAQARDTFVRNSDFAQFARYNFPIEGEMPTLEDRNALNGGE